jgi:hypothetical protein
MAEQSREKEANHKLSELRSASRGDRTARAVCVLV